MARPEALSAKTNPGKTNGHILQASPLITRELPEDMKKDLTPEPAFAELVAIEERGEIPIDDNPLIQHDPAEVATALPAYFAEVRKIPLLTSAEEMALGRAVQAGLAANATLSRTDLVLEENHRERLEEDRRKGQKARDGLIEGNLRLVISLAARYRDRGLPWEDLNQEGNLGLYHAVNKYDPEKGLRFSTYAFWWIRQGITYAIINQSRTVRLPYNFDQLLRRFDRYTQQHKAEEGREPTIEEISAGLSVTKAKAEELRMVASRQWISLNWGFPWSMNGNFEIGDNLEDPAASSLQEDATAKVSGEEMRDLVEKILKDKPQEWAVIRLRYGFDDGRQRTLQEVGDELGVSRERARQLEVNSLKRLRKSEARTILAQYQDEQTDQKLSR